MTRRFTINAKQTDRTRSIKVAVYEDLDRLRRDASAWSRQRGIAEPDDHYSEVLGIAHRFEQIDDNGKSLNRCAYVRLHVEHLGTGILSHEMTHAALWIYMLDVDDKHLPGDDIDKEEVLCHLVSDLTRAVVSKLYDFGFYGGD